MGREELKGNGREGGKWVKGKSRSVRHCERGKNVGEKEGSGMIR